MPAVDEDGVLDASDERRLTFLYATQTGNAQDFAESLNRHAIRLHFVTKCLSPEEYSPVITKVFFILTIGGSCGRILRDLPCEHDRRWGTSGFHESNSQYLDRDLWQHFWKLLLNRNIPSDFLEDMSFAVFGLGDSKYDK